MSPEFPSAVPEVPVDDVVQAVAYYVKHLGFKLDWRSSDGDIAGISQGHCRLFLTGPSFRQGYGNAAPVVIWLNLSSIEEVNQLHGLWRGSEAKIVSPPESKPWNLHEFTAADLDGNLLRVFYDFTHDGQARTK
jgi:catechol 2,3-dioxygenase-like lactoylglutathione lyase family enzyme